MLYIGTYFKCRRDIGKSVEVEDSVKLCSNEECTNNKISNNIVSLNPDNMYCPYCGQVTYFYKSTKKLYGPQIEYKIREDNIEVLKDWFYEYFTSIQTCIYYSLSILLKNEKFISEWDGACFDLSSGIPSSIDEGFKENEIYNVEEVLKKYYDEVEMIYGVVFKPEYRSDD